MPPPRTVLPWSAPAPAPTMEPPPRRLPPTLLTLTVDAALLHIAHIPDFSSIPDHILVELFSKTLRAGKLTDKLLRLFLATGNKEIHSLVKSLDIKLILTPVLPTRCSEKGYF